MRFILFFFCAIQLTAATIIREESSNGLWVDVHLNEAQDISHLIFSDGSGVRYEYKDRRLQSITRENASGEPLYTQTYVWDGAQLTSQTGWFTTHYTYDNEGRVISKSTPHYQAAIEYDFKGQPIRVGDRVYTYDAFGQITDEQGYFHATYDENYNLKELNGHSIHIDEQNRVAGLSYDTQGNFLKEGFVYDDKNQLIEASGQHYSYDSYGRRIQKGNISYLYLGFEEIASFENGQCKTLRVPGIGGSIAIEIDGKPYAPVTDAQGIIRKLIDPLTDTVYQEINCDIFGSGVTDAIPYAYRGKRYDPEAGLIYFGKRYYDPTLHRWLTQDPLGAIDHENLYQYIYNNPLQYWDPTGTNFWGYLAGACEIVAGGAIIAGGLALEVVTVGGFTIGVGLTTGTGAALIGHGLAMTTYHAQDIKLPEISWKNTQVYVPDRPLPNTPDGIHVPDTDAPHTQLGTKEGRKGPYSQAREFDQHGNPVRDIDFTDHARPQNHPNPHQHEHKPNPSGGSRIRDPIGKPVEGWDYL